MLDIKDLHFAFGKKTIFQGINLEFRKDEIIGIVGNNGVGKTTFFRILAGIYGMQGGTISFNNKKLSRSQLSFLPTEPYFYPYMKGMEYLKIVTTTASELEKSMKIASLLDLPLDELVDNYSTGMKKKIAFAAVFSLNRQIVILDEPYNGVDLESNEILKHIIKTGKENRIIILSSHILSTLTDISDSIYYFSIGQNPYPYLKNDFPDLKHHLEQQTHNKFGLQL